jgi:molybdopterin synthase catalytic subunit
MANPVCEVLLTDAPLAVGAAEFPSGSGGIVDFWGVVRPTENGRAIEGIDYEAHERMATHQLWAIAREAAEQFPLQQVCITHRIGFVPAGAASLLVRCASKHRAQAFAATQCVVDELKKRVPIWKNVRYRQEADARELATAAV